MVSQRSTVLNSVCVCFKPEKKMKIQNKNVYMYPSRDWLMS